MVLIRQAGHPGTTVPLLPLFAILGVSFKNVEKSWQRIFDCKA